VVETISNSCPFIVCTVLSVTPECCANGWVCPSAIVIEDGSNIKRQLEAFKNQISKNQISIADDDEKNMLFRDINEALYEVHLAN
jgi:hypothetical protein